MFEETSLQVFASVSKLVVEDADPYSECGADAPKCGVWVWCALRGRMIRPYVGAMHIRPGLA